MEVFFIFYGLIEATNAVYVYRGKNKYNLYITFIWGISFVLVGFAELLKCEAIYINSAYFLFGLSWFPMIFTPCHAKIFRINKVTLFIRGIIFCIIGVSQFYFLIF